MRRMFSENQLEVLIKQYAPEVTPEDIQAMFDEGEVSLAGKYVRIMKAPTSTTLTDEQIAQISEGVFMNGTFLNMKNPVFFPGHKYGAYIYGIAINVSDQGHCFIGPWRYSEINKKISLDGNKQIEFIMWDNKLNLKGVSSINGLSEPAVPADADTKTYIKKLVNGTLTWVEEV